MDRGLSSRERLAVSAATTAIRVPQGVTLGQMGDDAEVVVDAIVDVNLGFYEVVNFFLVVTG